MQVWDGTQTKASTSDLSRIDSCHFLAILILPAAFHNPAIPLILIASSAFVHFPYRQTDLQNESTQIPQIGGMNYKLLSLSPLERHVPMLALVLTVLLCERP